MGGDLAHGAFGFFIFALYLCFIIFWMVVAWRLMRANERTADATEHIARKIGDAGYNPKNQNE
jgi:uncharacterized membrane protein